MKARLENTVIKFYNVLPKRYLINGVLHNLEVLPIETQQAEGFYNVIQPTVTQYQRLETLIASDFNGSEWVYRVYNFTAQEIIDFDNQQAENIITNDLDAKERDGEKFFKELRNLVRKHYNLGNITGPQYKGIRTLLQPAIQPLRYGDWDLCQDNLNAITPPSNAKMLTLYNFIKNKVDSYINTNY